MVKRQLEKEFKEKDIEELYLEYILGQEVWYLKDFLKVENYSKAYDEIKKYISKKLKVHFNDIAIVGSAKTGFSFDMESGFREFRENSDIDILLVSEELYYDFWKAYKEMYYSGSHIKNYIYVTSCIFKGFVMVDSLDINNDFYRDWIIAVESFKKDLQLLHGLKHDINYRIFKSWRVAKDYYLHNIRSIKNKLSKES